MKLLVIDVGNTSTALGLWDSGGVGDVIHVDGRGDGALGGTEAEKRTRRGVQGVVYVSVVPDEDAKWRAWAQERGLPFHQVSHTDFEGETSVAGLILDYPHPETIGADRLADAAGAVSRYGAPVLVMDFGTALTAAVITEDRVWRGGVIAPGFPLMRDYLFERTAKLPRMELPTYEEAAAGCDFDIPKIGRSTEEAMRFGAFVGYRGMVREIVSELKKNFSADFKLVATGGFARYALKDIGLPFTIDPTLTLYGAGLVGGEKEAL